MKIVEVNLYKPDENVARENTPTDESAYPPRTNQMSIFQDQWKTVDDWREGSGAYESYVVELVTDTGETGFCVNVGGGLHACRLIDEHYRTFIQGANPFNIRHIWEQMYRAQLPAGQGGLNHFAISGVDLALYDLVGKITGQPVYNLIGGQVRERLPCYVTAHVDMMDNFADDGFFGVKLPMHWGPKDGKEGLNEIEQVVEKALDLYGEGTEIMIECYMSWDKEFTVRAAERLKKYDVKWIEDALLPGHAHDQYRDIRHDIKPIQIAAGNLEWGHKAFHQLINGGAADIIQPDLNWVGGMTEALRIAAMAKPNDLLVVPHVHSVYHLHFASAHAVTPFVEVFAGHSSIIDYVPAVINHPMPEDGYITVGDEPGFGIELDRKQIRPYQELIT